MTDEAAYNLTIEDHAGRRTVLNLDLQAGDATIGRLEDNAVQLDERNVSRRHARLGLSSGQVIVEDLDSYNGLWVNGERISGSHPLQPGDALRVGDFELSVRPARAAPEAPNVPDVPEPTQRLFVPGALQPLDDVTQPGVHPEPVAEPTSVVRLPLDKFSEVPPLPPSSAALIPENERGRLICVSTQFAGNTFELLRPETVIGRVEENDIAIDHRSISRQHARLIRRNGAYQIVDLQSVNGTLVNGEAYAQTELKHGDLLELGHVRLRFVAPGQTYSLSAAERQALGGPQRARRRRWVGWVSAVVLAGPLSFIYLNLPALRDRLGLVEPHTELLGPPPAAPAAPPLAPLPAPHTEADHLIDQARLAMQQRQWRRAETLCNAVLALDPSNPQGAPLVAQAQAEIQAQHSFDRAVSAAGQSQWYDAWNSLQDIGKQSVYAPQAASLLAQIRPALMTAGLEECRAAIKRDAYDAAAAQLDELAGLEAGRPEVAELRLAVENGRRRQEADKRPAERRAKAAAHKAAAAHAIAPAAAAAVPAAPPPEAVAQAAYADALVNLRTGNLQQAIDQLGRCIDADKNFSTCYRAMGIAYAKQGNAQRAVRFYRLYLKVDPQAHDASAVRELLQKYETGP